MQLLFPCHENQPYCLKYNQIHSLKISSAFALDKHLLANKMPADS
jgi:hypothetical protein